jgi:phosphate:Na+ symporter
MSLAAFHTAFIAVGVAIFLPWVGRFSCAIERVLPDRGPALTRHLDKTLLQAPAVALEATRRALGGTARAAMGRLRASLGDPTTAVDETDSSDLARALDRTQEFLAQVPPVGSDEPLSALRFAQMHAIDHLARLLARLDPPAGVRRALRDDRIRSALGIGLDILRLAESGLAGQADAAWLDQVRRLAHDLDGVHRAIRPAILEATTRGALPPSRALALLDAVRWMDRVGYHVWRACHHLGNLGLPAPVQPKADVDPEERGRG